MACATAVSLVVVVDFIFANSCDYKNARKIINGLDQWAVIKGFAEKLEAMLQANVGP
jgi:hypothetical protein